MPELSTLGSVIKPTYEAEPNTNAFTDPEKAKLANLADVATSGSYVDLTDKPTIPSGTYDELTGRPTLSPVATSGAYSDLTGTPALEFVPLSQKGANNGVAPLDAAGLVPLVHLNVSGLSFMGAWNPTTNTPSLVDGTGSVGQFYKASASGTFNFGNGNYTFVEGDWVIFAAGVWQRLGSSDAVSMVNGRVGAVVLSAEDVGALADDYAPAWSEVTGKPTLTNTVNGQSGTVVLNAASVGAKADSYVPSWDDVTGKPALPTFPTGSIIGPAVPAFLIRRTTAGSFQAGAARHIAWDDVVYDPFGGFAGDGRYTIPSWAGFARITVAVKLAQTGATGSYMYAYAYVNDSEVDQSGGAAINGTRQSARIITSIFPVSPGDSISSRLWHNYNSNRSLEVGATGSFMQIELFEAMT